MYTTKIYIPSVQTSTFTSIDVLYSSHALSGISFVFSQFKVGPDGGKVSGCSSAVTHPWWLGKFPTACPTPPKNFPSRLDDFLVLPPVLTTQRPPSYTTASVLRAAEHAPIPRCPNHRSHSKPPTNPPYAVSNETLTVNKGAYPRTQTTPAG